MSKIKSPQDKKRKSYDKDCRNTYGESDKASRKNIPRSKQRSKMSERRSVSELLRGQSESLDETAADILEHQVKVTSTDHRRKGFKKTPDTPLGKVIEKKK